MYGSARKSYLQMLDSIHNQGLRLCLGAFRTSPVESLHMDAHKPGLGARHAKLSLQYASKIKSLPKYSAHNAVFDNKYMKLFDARPSAICTFGLRIKQFLTASNIELSDILETPSYFILPPWCIKPPKIVLDLVHLKKDRTDASIYQQLFMEIRDRYRDYLANKLYSVKPVLGDWQSSYRWCRKDEVVLCHARIGHTHLTHS